jgi:hypothetical protein
MALRHCLNLKSGQPGYPSISLEAEVKLNRMQALCPKRPPAGSPGGGDIEAGATPHDDPA